MFVTVKKEKKRSSRATTTTIRHAAKHSSSEPSTPSPILPALTVQASTEGIMRSLQNLSFQSAERAAPYSSSDREPSNPIPIPPPRQYRRITTLRSLPMPSHPAVDDMKLGDAPNFRSPFTSMTTESFSSEGDGSALAINNSPSPKEPPSPDSLGIEFDCGDGDAGIPQEILTSDDEFDTVHGSTKRRASRSIFSSSPSPEPVRSLPIAVPMPSLKRARSQE